MTTDTKLKELIINKLTTSQYTSIEEKDPNQIYIVTDALAFDNTITNCLTHIPQDINLELVDDTLTSKAGSKVYVPNGFEADGTTPKFDYVTIESDVTFDGVSYNGECFVFYSIINNDLGVFSINHVASGTTQPTNEDISIWYDTANNIIKEKSNGVWAVVNQLCLPLAITMLQTATPYITSIDQVFNGFGYIGSTEFALPGVRGLIPNGRNADGTLKNIEFVTNKVLTKTFSNTATTAHTTMFLNKNEIGEATGLYYDTATNLNYWGANAPADNCFVGTFTLTNGVISNFKPKTPFQAVDSNSVAKHVLVSTLPVVRDFNTFYYIPS